MPLQRRLPKRGFVSLTKGDTAQVRTSDLARVQADVIDLLTLKQANIIAGNARSAKVFLSGDVARAVTVQGLLLTKGARAAVEAAGGKILEAAAE